MPGPAASTMPGPAASTTPGPAASTMPGPAASTTPGPAASTTPGPAASTTPGPAASGASGPFRDCAIASRSRGSSFPATLSLAWSAPTVTIATTASTDLLGTSRGRFATHASLVLLP